MASPECFDLSVDIHQTVRGGDAADELDVSFGVSKVVWMS